VISGIFGLMVDKSVSTAYDVITSPITVWHSRRSCPGVPGLLCRAASPQARFAFTEAISNIGADGAWVATMRAASRQSRGISGYPADSHPEKVTTGMAGVNCVRLEDRASVGVLIEMLRQARSELPANGRRIAAGNCRHRGAF
jgi:hypothetical protein